MPTLVIGSDATQLLALETDASALAGAANRVRTGERVKGIPTLAIGHKSLPYVLMQGIKVGLKH